MSSPWGSGVTVHYARAIIQAAADDDIALPPTLTRDAADGGRIQLAQQDALWEAWCSQTGDPLAALRLGSRIHVGHLDSAGVLLMTCETLGEALQELQAYAPVIGEGVSFTLQRARQDVRVELEHRFTVRARERVESAVAALVHLARWATDDTFRASGVWFTHGAPAPVTDYEQVLGTRVRFDAPVTALCFGADQLRLSMAQADPSLRDHVRHHADRILDGLDEHDVTRQVQRVIRRHPEWGRDQVAEHLGFSGRHLGRLLLADGLTFRVAREHTLEDLALARLRDGRSVSHVAASLGYADETSFTRAFRRWQGTTPGRYRTPRVRAGRVDPTQP